MDQVTSDRLLRMSLAILEAKDKANRSEWKDGSLYNRWQALDDILDNTISELQGWSKEK